MTAYTVSQSAPRSVQTTKPSYPLAVDEAAEGVVRRQLPADGGLQFADRTAHQTPGGGLGVSGGLGGLFRRRLRRGGGVLRLRGGLRRLILRRRFRRGPGPAAAGAQGAQQRHGQQN